MLYIDAQLFQTSTWNRGMGKYSLEAIKELLSLKSSERVRFVINSNISFSEERRDYLLGLSEYAECIELPFRCKKDNIAIDKVIDFNQSILAELKLNRNDVYFIPSIFENEVVPVFPKKTKKIAVLYDLIPHLYYDAYLKNNPHSRENYYGRYKILFEADTLVSISETTKNDAMLYLGIPSERIVNIDGARIAPTDELSQPNNKLNRKFFLSPSGDDIRKNNDRMVRAFEIFNQQNNNKYDLYITSNFSQHSKLQLKKLSKNVHFLGNISQEELNWYYKNCEAVLFVPEYEGLGLPLLEAVHHNKPIVCSDIPVFRELVKGFEKDFVMPEPTDTSIIADSLSRIVSLDFSSRAYTSIRNKYTWERTGGILADVISSAAIIDHQSRKKIAIIGPKIGGKSAIGNVMEISHFALSQNAFVDYFFEIPNNDRPYARSSFVEYISKCSDIEYLNLRFLDEYDEVIFHLGSSTYHLKSIILSLAYSATVVLHDTDYSGAFLELLSGGYISRARYDAEIELNKIFNYSESEGFLASIINNAKKVVVHSDFAKQIAEKTLIQFNYKENKLIKAPLPVGQINSYEIFEKKSKTIVMAGIISQAKGLSRFLELVKDERFNNYKFILCGYDYAMDRAYLNKIKLEYPKLEIKTNLDKLSFNNEINKSLILFNYRDYYHGETSYATLEAMRVGVIPIVRNIGWFGELPKGACIRAGDNDKLGDILSEYTNNYTKLGTISYNAAKYVNTHSPEEYIKAIIGISEK